MSFLFEIDMEQAKITTIFFDFHKVLCHGHFYESTLLPKYTDVSDWISKNIFFDQELVRDWMRGKTNWRKLHDQISLETGMDRELLDYLFVESVKQMKMDEEMIGLVRELKQAGYKLGMITDNMDIFTEVTIPHQEFNLLFDAIYNSADHGLLKMDDDGALYKRVCEEMSVPITECLFIDDSQSNTDLFMKLGGRAILHKNHSSTCEQLFSLL